MNWPLVKLKHITRTVAGGTPNVSEVKFWSDDDETGTAWVSIGDMSGRATVAETGRRVTEAGIRSARLPIGEPGTLLLSMYASLGHSAVLKVYASWNQAILGIYPRMSCDGRFLKYALVSLKPHLSEFARSNTQDNLNAEQVGNLEVPFPPLDEQRRIADFLDADTARIDQLARKMQAQDDLLVTRRRALLAATWSHEVRVARLGYFLQLVTSGPRDWGEYVAPGGTMFFRSANLKRDSISANLDSIICVAPPFSAATGAARSKIHVDDVLVGITGANTGWVALADGEIAGSNVSQHVCLLRPSPAIHGRWFAYLLSSPNVQDELLGSQYGGTKTQLSLPDLRDLRVPLPSIQEQERTAKRIQQEIAKIEGERSMRRRQLNLLAERRQALITAAVTGQLDVTTARGGESW